MILVYTPAMFHLWAHHNFRVRFYQLRQHIDIALEYEDMKRTALDTFSLFWYKFSRPELFTPKDMNEETGSQLFKLTIIIAAAATNRYDWTAAQVSRLVHADELCKESFAPLGDVQSLMLEVTNELDSPEAKWRAMIKLRDRLKNESHFFVPPLEDYVMRVFDKLTTSQRDKLPVEKRAPVFYLCPTCHKSLVCKPIVVCSVTLDHYCQNEKCRPKTFVSELILPHNLCHVCHREARMKCGRCEETPYCDRTCQRFDYAQHKRKCVAPPPKQEEEEECKN
jgi:CDGSH-type Zn-finger protein